MSNEPGILTPTDIVSFPEIFGRKVDPFFFSISFSGLTRQTTWIQHSDGFDMFTRRSENNALLYN